MSSSLPKDLSALDDRARLSTFEAPLLDTREDAELHALVAEAARISGFPIALVSMVVRQIQFFKAQVGLPPDLEAARATDRCSSFCQYVVAGNQPLRIEDAMREEGLPQELVKNYGIRAYVGFPLRVLGQVVGSFCVIHTEPARLPPEVLTRLEELALAASARLETLVRQEGAGQGGSEQATQAHEAWMSLAETQPLLKLSEQFAEGRLSLEEFQRGVAALASLTEAGGTGRPR
jgi:GAF domain-containing protein